MKRSSQNRNLNNARTAKKDEFYTQLTDIEKELRHYEAVFKGKVVYCNCDDPKNSSFFHYFSYKFESLQLKKLLTTCYKNKNIEMFSQNDTEQAIYLEYTGPKKKGTIPLPESIGVKYLKSDGDFRSKESIELLKQSDIVVTNPPFSLFREYVAQIIEYKKKFIIIGNLNAVTYKEIFNLIKENKIWFGIHNGDMEFIVPNHYQPRETRYREENGVKYRSLGTICWFTNLDNKKRHENFILYKKYNPKEYPKYDNYDSINVNSTKDIPYDYYEIMGVPITFLEKYNPDQFEIIDMTSPKLNGKTLYKRVMIKRKIS